MEENQSVHLSSFSLGANTSDDKEKVGAQDGTGEYIIGRNQRSVSLKGNTGSSEKINGEQLKYFRNVVGSYRCIGTTSVNGNIFEAWASTVGGEDPLFRINGVVVAKSPLMGFTWNHPFQIDKNENEQGGEVFITDFNVEPCIFNIQDMIDSLTTAPTKYFSAYNPRLYSVNIAAPLDIPKFIETVNVGGGGGLPIGSYTYQLRYSTKDGDRTNLSQRTPLIPIVQNLSEESEIYPGSKTYGQDPSPNFGTRYGVKLRFRITNLQGYDFIEVIRTSFNTNGGIGFTPAPEVIAKIDIFNGEVSVRDFIDPVESNVKLSLSDEEVNREITYINRAKGIRYFDRRTILMNVEVASKTSELEYLEIGGKTMFPVIDKIGTAGFKDPYNFVYKKSYMHGERFGFAVQVYDGVGGKGFASKVPGGENYLMPNRRDTVSAETDLYSYTGVVETMNVFNILTKTHEVFEHYNAIRKTDKCSFINILHNTTLDSVFGVKNVSDVQEDCNESVAEIETHGAEVDFAGVAVSPYYHPFTPTSQNDSNVGSHNYIVNTRVCEDSLLAAGFPVPGSEEEYSPKIFAPTYYSQGMALAGVQNFPLWAKSFSVVRTAPAGRVVAQGIGMYSMIPALYNKIGTNAKLTTKDTEKFWFFSPDIENGVISGQLVNDIIESPENYQVQFVSPLGFASEVYSFDSNVTNIRDGNVDIIAYARMMRDIVSGPEGGEINPMEDPSMGIVDGGYNYVGYGKWRNVGQQPGLFASGDGGNNLFGLTNATRITEGRGTYMSLTMNASLYGSPTVGGTVDAGFEDDGMKNFTEPFYIVNIISSGAAVRNQNIENYSVTSHYQKLESVIGISDGTITQKYQLVDERWEDAIPALSSAHPLSSTPRYVYVRKVNGDLQAWVNVTYLTPANIATISTAIAGSGSYTGAFGTNVKGMYRHENDRNRFFKIVFNVNGYFPAANDVILVKYDNGAPISFWGGDTLIGESIFSPIDREGSSLQATGSTNPANTQFQFGIGFPYRIWKMNPRVYQIKRTTGSNEIQNQEWGYLGLIRQMCVMFTAETRIATPYAHSNGYPLDFFPSTHYVMRPHRWETDTPFDNIYPEYFNDYPGEQNNWKWGGIRFRQNMNPDYSALPPKEFVSQPEFGFEERTHFPTRNMWSLPRQINQQNTPGLKTFPANNSFDIDDNQGEIKRAWEATTDKGENLYAITNKGICLLVTKKSILTDINGGELAYMGTDSFIRQQYWLNKEVGMFDEMWRSAAEGYVPVTLQDESEVRVEALFFANNESVFRFMDNQLKDVGRINYHNTIYPEVLSKIQPGYSSHVCAVFDKYSEEYKLHVNTEYEGPVDPSILINRTEVFGQKNSRWYGYHDFRFDKFLAIGNKTYGMRNMETFELNLGYTINGAPIIYEITGVSAPKQFADKEFIRVRINTGEEVKPTSVEFYDKYQGPVISKIDASQGPLYLKKYRGYEGYIGRKLLSYDPNRGRVQGRLLIWKIIHNLPEDFRIIDIGIQYKEIK